MWMRINHDMYRLCLKTVRHLVSVVESAQLSTVVSNSNTFKLSSGAVHALLLDLTVALVLQGSGNSSAKHAGSEWSKLVQSSFSHTRSQFAHMRIFPDRNTDQRGSSADTVMSSSRI